VHNADAIKNEEQAQAKKKLLCAAKKKKGKFDANEQRVFEWYQQQKMSNAAITNVLIQHRMLEDVRMHESEGADKFKASEGWLRRFFIRFNITNPKTNKASRAISKDFVPVITKFLNEVQATAANYASNQIFNLNESCFFMDMPGNSVVSRKQKLKLSCIFCADANGIKMPILCVVPKDKQIPDLEIDENIIIVYDNEGVFNTNILVDHFISRILKPHFLKWQITKSLVILDHDRNHITHIFKNTMESLGAELVFIPPNLTSLLQPSDVSWFKVLKDEYKKEWNNWFVNDPKTFNDQGNICGPGYDKMTKWISKGWKNLEQSSIRSSFKQCGITAKSAEEYNDHLKETLNGKADIIISISDDYKIGNEDEQEFRNIFCTDNDDNQDDLDVTSDASETFEDPTLIEFDLGEPEIAKKFT